MADGGEASIGASLRVPLSARIELRTRSRALVRGPSHGSKAAAPSAEGVRADSGRTNGVLAPMVRRLSSRSTARTRSRSRRASGADERDSTVPSLAGTLAAAVMLVGPEAHP